MLLVHDCRTASLKNYAMFSVFHLQFAAMCTTLKAGLLWIIIKTLQLKQSVMMLSVVCTFIQELFFVILSLVLCDLSIRHGFIPLTLIMFYRR